MRYLIEVLFPILRYTRQRREVGAIRSVLWLLLAFLAAMLMVPSVGFITIVGGSGALIGSLELSIALSFVRKRPGRRRSLCTWQTVKYVMVGGRTWVVLIVLWILTPYAVGPMMDSSDGLVSMSGVVLVLLIFLVAPVVLIGATAAHAANAVVAIQDDRACKHCGYFLIGLPSNRCPECGTAFDPAKLAYLAAAADEAIGADGKGGSSL